MALGISDEEWERASKLEDGEIMAPIEICDNSYLALSFGNHVRGIIAQDIDRVIIEGLDEKDE